jgi:protoporphyrinogen oxidase
MTVHNSDLAAREITVIGGGPAGLAAAYYSTKRGIPVTLYESATAVGGNCRTLRHGEFLFDTGAHRIHDKIPEITEEIQALLGNDLLRSTAPSQITFHGKRIDFPLSPLNLLTHLGPATAAKAILDFLRAKVRKSPGPESFEQLAVGRYGQTLANAFLLGYSAKLWGTSPDCLSQDASGSRLKGLDLQTFLLESLKGKHSKTRHLDGSFYYPRLGIGMLMDRLAEVIGSENIRTQSGVTRVLHENHRITQLEVNHNTLVPVSHVVSSLPLSVLLNGLDPAPPAAILEKARSLKFRHVLLTLLLLNRSQVSANATIYFPDADIPFTRAYEPRNRSAAMTPPNMTSLVVELPYGSDEDILSDGAEAIVQRVTQMLVKYGYIKAHEVVDATVTIIPYAYPVLELGYKDTVREVMSYLDIFSNLQISGRSGTFAYAHIHDVLLEGKQIIERYARTTNRAAVG